MNETRELIKDIIANDERIVEEIRKLISEQHSVEEWEEYYDLDDIDDKKEYIRGTLLKVIYSMRD